ncbi:adenosylcobinamide-GDP ribazoletransferase [Rhodococcoides kyotonense]|uniref:Adenosylcobinamide-GDP ribazoletransferase n=1 Tax=Rhodococcoides kyotonense TaxID=398843 RepID=A0A239KZV1_9NOCA|nr:adenosylcobinamide-GDP ribazoletransferase [Rhodococcus kyotonensis]SNT23009.1 adenosylcobinamide-GDP ribazoletransferase [Rhodococcus kyotonensis]
MRAAIVGPALALSWLTVLPVRGPQQVDRAAATKAIASAPLVGLLLGSLAALTLWAAGAGSLNGILAGFLAVGLLALVTRGMHVDGLADTVDGLGCYGPPERAREVMQSGGAGPFGVAAIVVVFAVQATGFASLADRHAWWSIVFAAVVGRVCVVLACRRGVPAASERGFGALVAGTQQAYVIAIWMIAALGLSTFLVDDRWWQGPIVVAAAAMFTELAVRHCCRRFGGLSGDVLGAVVEVTTAITVVGLLLGGR